jgi:hypothetical protein
MLIIYKKKHLTKSLNKRLFFLDFTVSVILLEQVINITYPWRLTPNIKRGDSINP